MNPLIFPAENAPKFLKEFGGDIADVYGVSIEFSIVSLISGFASAIGNKAMLRTEKYINYTVSGEMMNYAIELCRYFIETGQKMYASPPPPNLTSGELYRALHQTIGIRNQTMFAESLGITSQAVSKALSVIKTQSCRL
jgi:hypothetical protein